jgi:hypothetical protein
MIPKDEDCYETLRGPILIAGVNFRVADNTYRIEIWTFDPLFCLQVLFARV